MRCGNSSDLSFMFVTTPTNTHYRRQIHEGGRMDPDGLQRQMAVFRPARIILGAVAHHIPRDEWQAHTAPD